MNQEDIDAIFVEGTPLGRTTVHARALERDRSLGRDSKGRPADSAITAGLLLVDDEQETEKGAMGRPTTRLVPASWSLRVELPVGARTLEDGARAVLRDALRDYAKVWCQMHTGAPVAFPGQPVPVPVPVPVSAPFTIGDFPPATPVTVDAPF